MPLVTRNASTQNLFVQASQPADLNGAWIDSDDSVMYALVNGTATTVGQFTLGSELSSTPITDDQETIVGFNAFVGYVSTLPSTADYYVITAIEIKTGTVATGAVYPFAYVTGDDPPTGQLVLCAIGEKTTITTGTTYKMPTIGVRLVAGGSKIFAGFTCNTDNRAFRSVAKSSENTIFGLTANGDSPIATNPSYSAAIYDPYVKIYYKAVQ